MADSPRKRYSRSPSPWDEKSRSHSRSLSRSRSRSRSWPRPRGRSRSRSQGRAEVSNPGNTLYVTGLSTRVTERDLEEHFSKEGKVKSVFLVVEPRSRISRGIAFITMDSLEDANRCIKNLNQSVLEGRYITVEKVFWLYSEDITSAVLAAIKDDQFFPCNIIFTQLDQCLVENAQGLQHLVIILDLRAHRVMVIVVIVVGIAAVMTMGIEDLQGARHIEVYEVILLGALHVLEGQDVCDPGHILLMRGTIIVVLDRGFTRHIWSTLWR